MGMIISFIDGHDEYYPDRKKVKMKKLCRKIKLLKYKTQLNEETTKELSGTEFIVLYHDRTYELCWSKHELIELLKKDHIKEIRYIFDMTDRILVRRDILIETDDI